MRFSIVNRIRDMGQDFTCSIDDIDEFVNACIGFLRNQIKENPELHLVNDIFELESARQDAILSKFCLTIQP